MLPGQFLRSVFNRYALPPLMRRVLPVAMTINDKVSYFFSVRLRTLFNKAAALPQVQAQPGAILPPDTPIPLAFAHNDYEHARPLFDALALGFGAIEADIHSVNGKTPLLVSHTAPLDPADTLEALYLAPLARIAAENGGRIYKKSDTPLLLNIELKTDGRATYMQLKPLLEKYKDILTAFDDNGVAHQGAVTIILTGALPTQQTFAQDKLRYAAPASQFGKTLHPHTPLDSEKWGSHFTWDGKGIMPVKEFLKLGRMVKEAHEAGRALRFWATPDIPALWAVLAGSGVDYISTDNMPRLAHWVSSPQGKLALRAAQVRQIFSPVRPA